ncbi:MAG: response regulator [Candidatus Zixiibacteriota bacterium]
MARILIIDDSKVMRDLLCDFLTDEGFEVEATGDSREGIHKGIYEPFDICICDIHLPDKNGYEIFTEISSQKPDIQFILTDSLPDHLSERAKKAGAYYHLKKPFELEQLREIIGKILNTIKTS